MIPFDPNALLAMLLAFYPIVGPAALEQARRERPEYFANGEIMGTNRDRFQLADGRVFDCIFGASGPSDQWRWQVIELVAGPELPPDPFLLEAGPVRPIDESAYQFPPYGDVFGALVRGGLAELPAVDQRFDAATSTITQVLIGGIDPARDAPLIALAGEPGAFDAALVQAIPDVELGASHEQSGEAAGTRHDFDEALPDEIEPGPDVPAPPTGPDTQQPDTQ
jgi:hypothetical protein